MTRMLWLGLGLASCGDKESDLDGDGYTTQSGDCDDDDASIHPDGIEDCDGVDNDCDGEVDESGGELAFFMDGDGDGVGAGDPLFACEAPAGFVDTDGDCHDADPAVYPGADFAECDCDLGSGPIDSDGDGSEICHDCDDNDPNRSPDAIESCDGIDNNCNGKIDDDAATGIDWYADVDQDGFGDPDAVMNTCSKPKGYVDNPDDCYDLDAAMFPGAPDAACDCDNGASESDQDTDGAPTCADCNDHDNTVHPGADEFCNGKDDDCDGDIDNDPVDGTEYWSDADEDGYGDPGSSLLACSRPSGTAANNEDCNDDNTLVYPGQTEQCNGYDDDCDGDVDDDDASLDPDSATTYYQDNDGDLYGSEVSAAFCDLPTGYAAEDGDCNDSNGSIHPGASDAWYDGIDSNCDDANDYDQDGDGFDSEDYDGSDCNDTNNTISPNADEACNGVDDNCDSVVDEGVLGSGSSCAAESCQAIVDADASVGDGTYWIDDGSGPVQLECFMDNKGAWTQVMAWDRLNDGDTVDDFTSWFTENINNMGTFDQNKDSIYWCDGNSSADVLDYHLPINIPNNGELWFSYYLTGTSMEDSANFFTAETSRSEYEVLCVDDHSSAYSSIELGYLPSYTCSGGGYADYTFEGWTVDEFAEIEGFRITSFHDDEAGASCEDQTEVYYLNLWVR